MLLFERPLLTAYEFLVSKGIKSKDITAIDNLKACYLIEHGLKKNRDSMLDLTSSRSEFFKWEEQLYMLEHSLVTLYFPNNLDQLPIREDLQLLSQLISAEQIKLTFLSRIMETLVNWRP